MREGKGGREVMGGGKESLEKDREGRREGCKRQGLREGEGEREGKKWGKLCCRLEGGINR